MKNRRTLSLYNFSVCSLQDYEILVFSPTYYPPRLANYLNSIFPSFRSIDAYNSLTLFSCCISLQALFALVLFRHQISVPTENLCRTKFAAVFHVLFFTAVTVYVQFVWIYYRGSVSEQSKQRADLVKVSFECHFHLKDNEISFENTLIVE